MEETRIKLLDNYTILLHPRDEEKLMVFNLEEEKIQLILNLGSLLQDHDFDMQRVLPFFLSPSQLSKTIEGTILLKIFKMKKEWFLEILEGNVHPINDAYQEYESNRLIPKDALYTTYFEEDRQSATTYFVWRIDQTTHEVIEHLIEKEEKLFVVVDSTQDDDFSIYRDKLFMKLGISSLKQYLELFAGKVQILEKEQLMDEVSKHKQILQLIPHDKAKNSKSILTEIHSKQPLNSSIMYGFYEKDFIFGPLILGNDLNYLDSWGSLLAGKEMPESVVESKIISAFTIRLVTFLNKGTLPYLSKDVQLPIRQLFMFDNKSLNSKIYDLEVDTFKRGI